MYDGDAHMAAGLSFMMGHIHYLYTRADAAGFAGWPRVYR